ncbi:hypothetical protein [Microbacterium candidum]|uniref:EamA domain-containing protein n=1 Tax=Microbacterium candidum TaxID=3041922 RepID=A0ABT7MTW1_9MICO|nr:hypothetical protein [Microbacterium sp. ASV49]MDL9977891.1 hypothetical protein [Microbacterium sp. ASV49]
MRPSLDSSRAAALACGILAMILTGSSVAVIGATAALPVFAVQSARYAIAAVIVGAIVLWRARRPGVRGRRAGACAWPMSRGPAPVRRRDWSASTCS